MNVKNFTFLVFIFFLKFNFVLTQTANEFIIEGNQTLSQNNFREAIIKFNSALQIEPDNFLAFFGNASAYEKLNKFDTSIYFYRKTLILKKDLEQAHFRLGIIRYNLKSFNQSMSDFEQVLKINPNNYEAVYYIANTYFKLGYYVASFNNYKLLYNITNDKSYYLKACLSQIKTNNFPKTIKEFDILIKNYPEYDSAYFYRGITKFSNKDYESAKKDFLEAIKLNPNLVLAYVYIGRSASLSNKKDDSTLIIYNWKKINPDFIKNELETAYNYYYEKEYNFAINHFDNIIAADSTRADIYYFISQSYFNLGDYFRSKEYANLSLKFSHNNNDALLLKGQSCFKLYIDKLKSKQESHTIVINDLSVEGIKSSFQKVFDKIKKHENNNYDDSTFLIVNQILNYDSLNYNAYLLKGDILCEKKLYDSALKQYNIAIEISDEPDCIYKRALLFFQIGNYEAALTDIEKIITSDVNSLDFKIIRAILKQYIPGKDSESHKEFEIIFSDEINKAEAYTLKGYYLMNYQHFYKESIIEFNRALEIDPFLYQANLYRNQALSKVKYD